MKKFLLAGLVCAAFSSNAAADTVRPDVAQLLEATKMKDLAETSVKQVQAAFEKQLTNSLVNDPNASVAMKKMMERLSPILEKSLSWEVTKPDYVKMYEETFTPEEIKGLLEFYKTPVGQSFLKKMPVITQKIAEVSARRVQQLIPEVQKAAMEVQMEMRAAAKASATASPSPSAAPATPAKK